MRVGAAWRKAWEEAATNDDRRQLGGGVEIFFFLRSADLNY